METKWVMLKAYSDVTMAEIDKGILMAAGIEAYLDGANIVTANSLLTNAVGGIKLFVSAHKREQAVTILSN